MKHRTWYKIISVLLSIVLLIGAVPTSVIALDEEMAGIPPTVDAVEPNATAGSGSFDAIGSLDNIPLQAGEKSLAELQTMTVDLASIPEVIDVAHAQAKGHVNRLYAQENSLSTVIYQNRDGTKSTYFFSRPVKYVTADGTVRDRSSEVSPILNTTYSYAMLDNSTKVYFGKTAHYGTLLQFGSYAINMSPKSEAASTAVQNEDGSILYGDVFGARTAVLYKAELNGVKEDIILFSNVGKSSFEFVLYAQNATPVQNGGVWQFENAAGDVVAQLDRIWVKDSAGHTTEGTLTLTPTDLAGFYDVTVSVAESFLNDASTVYPVYIDPTTTIWETDTYIVPDDYDMSYDSILDTGLYETADARDSAIQNMEMSVEMGDPLVHPVGNDGKLVYKFPGFYETYLWEGETYYCSSVYNLNASQIGRATLYFEELNGDSITLNVSAMTDTWDDTADDSIAVYEDGLWDAYSTQLQTLQTLTQNADGYYAADVTDIFREWARYNEFERTNDPTANNPFIDPANGLVLSNDAAYLCEILATATYGNATVYVELDTSYFGGFFTISNPGSSVMLKSSYDSEYELYDLIAETRGEEPLINILWKFEYLGDNRYYIRSALNPDYMLCVPLDATWLCSITLEQFQILDADRYTWILNLSHSGGRTIQNVYNNEGIRWRGTYLTTGIVPDVTSTFYSDYDWGLVSESNYVDVTALEIEAPASLFVGESAATYFEVVPENATFDGWSYITVTSSNPDVATVSETGRITAKTVGTTTLTYTHNLNNVSASVELEVRLPSGVYYIMNKQAGSFVEVYGGSMAENTSVRIADLHNGAHQKWEITHIADGFYTIVAWHSDKYMGVAGSSVNNGAPVVQVTTALANTLWKITRTDSGAYKLIPQTGEAFGFCLTLNNSACVQETYTQDNSYEDEWYFANVNYRVDFQVFFDNGYESSNTDTATTMARIYNNLYIVRQELMERFGICLNYGTPTKYTSYADECGQDICTHVTDAACENPLDAQGQIDLSKVSHHTNVASNICMLYDDLGVDAGPFIAFYEQGLCLGEPHAAVYGAAIQKWKIAGIGVEDLDAEIKTTLHEIGHWFEAPDHYDIGETDRLNEAYGSDIYNDNCIYGHFKNREDVISKLTICQGCQLKIESYLALLD